MKAASLKEIKTELAGLHPSEVVELCMKVLKYKKENKELLSYLLFEAHNEDGYIADVKAEMDELFEDVNKSNIYLAKKTIRKVLKITNKYIKYSGSKETEAELLIYFCKKVRKTGITFPSNSALGMIYTRQILKINKAIAALHEDLQFDYTEKLKVIY
jgi:hypothetical protein